MASTGGGNIPELPSANNEPGAAAPVPQGLGPAPTPGEQQLPPNQRQRSGTPPNIQDVVPLDPPEDDEDLETPVWGHYRVRAELFFTQMNAQVSIIKTKLGDINTPADELDLVTMRNELRDLKEELNAYKTEYHTAGMRDNVPARTMAPINTALSMAGTNLTRVLSYIEVQLTRPAAPTMPQLPVPNAGDFSLANLPHLLSAVQNVANSPTLELPLFYGEITAYQAFKKNFIYLINQVTGPKHLWATHLVTCMRGEAKEYVGDSTRWFDKYDDLWESLDDKYGNAWVLNTDTVRGLFGVPPPPPELQPTIKFFFAMLQALQAIEDLGLTTTQIGLI